VVVIVAHVVLRRVSTSTIARASDKPEASGEDMIANNIDPRQPLSFVALRGANAGGLPWPSASPK
jgi:hypothetical protein